MPSPINVPKAPAGWKPSGDLASRVAADPRMQRMSRDELYAMSGARPATVSRGAPAEDFGGAFRERSRGGILGAALNKAANAMKPKRK